jgi:hypothetical protein
MENKNSKRLPVGISNFEDLITGNYAYVDKTAYYDLNHAEIKMFVLIDEYDHFANDLIATGFIQGDDVYRRMVRANGSVRDFYETLKVGTYSA